MKDSNGSTFIGDVDLIEAKRARMREEMQRAKAPKKDKRQLEIPSLNAKISAHLENDDLRRGFAPLDPLQREWAFRLLGVPMTGTNRNRIVMLGKGDARRPSIMKSQDAEVWQTEMVRQLKKQFNTSPITELVEVTYHIYRAIRTGDTFNFCKPIDDALQEARVLANDKQIEIGHVYRKVDAMCPRIEITLMLL